MHSDRVKMGALKSSFKLVKSYKTDTGEVIDAGKFVFLKNDGTVTLTKGSNLALGVSLGKDMSNTGMISVVLEGIDVPVLVKSGATLAIGGQLAIETDTGLAVATGGAGTDYNGSYTSAKLASKGIAEDATSDVGTLDVVLVNIIGGV